MIKYVDKETLEGMTEENKKLLAALGVEVKLIKEKRNNERRPKAPEEYILHYEIKCTTCKAKLSHTYYMQRKGYALCSREIYEEDLEAVKDLPVRTIKYSTNVCSKCKERLSLLPKKDIINMLVHSLMQEKIKS